MTVTKDLIESVKTPAGEWTKRTLHLLGVSWPPQKGWADKIIGQEIGDSEYQQLLSIGQEQREK